MVRFLIATHGTLAKGFESALNVLIGNVENIKIINCFVDDQNPQKQIKDYINSIGNDELIMFSDICGGSINQFMNEYLDRPNTYQITGVNLAVLIEIIVSNKEHYTKEELEDIVLAARNNLCLVSLDVDEENELEEDFF